MKWIVALLLMALSAPAQAQTANCSAEWAALSNVLMKMGRISNPLPGLIRQTADGGCRTSGLTIPVDSNITLRAESLTWKGENLTWLATGSSPPTSFLASLKGISVIPDIGDPVFSYLQGIQMRGSKIDLGLSLEWNAKEQVLSLDGARLEFPDHDFVELSAKVEGVDITSLPSLQTSVGRFGVTKATTTIRTTQFFQSYLLLPLGMALLDGAEDPEAETRRLKDVAISFLRQIPDDVLSAGSKTALMNLVSDMPEPSGTLRIEQTASPGIGPGRALAIAMNPEAFEDFAELMSLLDGIDIEITYDRH